MKVGITGASGFIGSFLCNYLHPKYSVTGLSRKLSIASKAIARDYGSVDQHEQFFLDSDVLIHLANSNRPRDTPRSYALDIEDNLLKTIRLFEAYFKKRPDGHIVFFSTGGTIYRERSERTPFSEIDCTDPRSSYSNQKLMIENLLKLMCEEKGLSGTVLRVSNPYGVRLDAKRNQGLIGVATSCALNGQEFSLFGNPDLVRDYIHLDDLCSAVERVLDAKICKSGFQLYNVGSGEGHTTQEVLSLINCFSPKPLKIKMQDANSIEPQWNILDTTKFRNTYSWSPIKSLEEGIRELFL